MVPDVAYGVGPGEAPPAASADPGGAVEVSYVLTTGDVFAAGIVASRYSIASNGLGAALMTTGLFALVANGDATGFISLAIGLAILSGYLFAVISTLMLRRRPDLLQQSIELTVTAAGIRSVMPSMSSDAAWSSYKRIRPTRSTVLLELGTGPAVLVPSRVFAPDQRRQVLGWAAAAGVLDDSSPARQILSGIVAGVIFNGVIFGAVVVANNL